MAESIRRAPPAQSAHARARSVDRIVQATRAMEGGGFPVRRPFPTRTLDQVDPFLLLDEMGPVDYAPGEAKGAPDHPHRGFETVTYLLEGRMEHHDSAGRSGRLNPGDVQWMTAGDGVVHSEMPEKAFLEAGGRMHGFQLWVNLPRSDKRIAPRYQDVPAPKIPEAWTADRRVRARVIAGEALGVHAVVETRIPIHYVHYTLSPGGSVGHPVPAETNAFAYVFRGRGTFGADARPAQEGELVLFKADGDRVAIACPDGASEPLEVLLIAGRPLHEPVVRHGPFVMNTEAEIFESFRLYEEGRLGRIER